jgi:hypothetical protein
MAQLNVEVRATLELNERELLALKYLLRIMEKSRVPCKRDLANLMAVIESQVKGDAQYSQPNPTEGASEDEGDSEQ